MKQSSLQKNSELIYTKIIIGFAPGPSLIKLFCPYFTNFCNKHECLSSANLSSLVKCLGVRLEPTRVKHLSGSPLQGRLLTFPTNIRIGWINLPGANTLAYYENLYITDKKSFKTLTPEQNLLLLMRCFSTCFTYYKLHTKFVSI